MKTGVNAGYLYDPMDRQSQKNVGGTKTDFIYNGLQRIAEYDGTNGDLNTRFVYATGLDEPVVEVDSGGTKTFLHRDRLGSVIARTNGGGAVTDRYEYGPYGESAALSGTNFGFTGQRFDAESGLYFYKSRYYSPAIGRFLQPDIIGYEGGLNLYQYADSEPLNYVDSCGCAPIEDEEGILPRDEDESSGSYKFRNETTGGGEFADEGRKSRKMYGRTIEDNPRDPGTYKGVRTDYDGQGKDVYDRVNKQKHQKLHPDEAVKYKSMPGSTRFDREVQEARNMGPEKSKFNDRYSVSQDRWKAKNVPGPHPSQTASKIAGSVAKTTFRVVGKVLNRAGNALEIINLGKQAVDVIKNW